MSQPSGRFFGFLKPFVRFCMCFDAAAAESDQKGKSNKMSRRCGSSNSIMRSVDDDRDEKIRDLIIYCKMNSMKCSLCSRWGHSPKNCTSHAAEINGNGGLAEKGSGDRVEKLADENTSCAQDEKVMSQNESHKRQGVTSSDVADENTSANETPTSVEARDCHEEHSEPMDVSAAPPSASPQIKTHRGREVSGVAVNHDTSKTPSSLTDVLWHLSDLSVRPVMPSRKSDKEVVPSLPFETPQPSDLVKMGKQELERLNNRIITVISGSSSGMSDKQNLIRYLEKLSSNADAADILTNGPIMLVLVKVLRLSKTPAFRVQIASLIGLLIRHSTSIGDELANSGILDSLTNGLRDKHEKVRRFSMAALGELLFYISTQNEHKDLRPTESPSKETRSASVWQVSNALISLVSSVLRKGEDDLTQLYALRTIENICSQGAYWATRFSSLDLISNLCYIYRATGKQESMRQTAGSCLVRLARFNPPCIQTVVEKLSLKEIASSFVKGSAREKQVCLNLLSMAMIGSHTFTGFGRHLVTLTEEKNLFPSLLSIIEQGTEVLRGKALLVVAFLCKNSRRWLTNFFCNSRFLPVVDRLAKEKDSYVQQCLEAFVNVIVSIIPGLLDTITSDIQQLMTGRRQGPVSPLNSRAPVKTSAHLFPVVLHLLGSSSFKNKMVVTPQVLRQLANLTKLVEASFQVSITLPSLFIFHSFSSNQMLCYFILHCNGIDQLLVSV